MNFVGGDSCAEGAVFPSQHLLQRRIQKIKRYAIMSFNISCFIFNLFIEKIFDLFSENICEIC